MHDIIPYYKKAQKKLGLSETYELNAKRWIKYCTDEERTFFNSEHLLPIISIWGKTPIRFGNGSES